MKHDWITKQAREFAARYVFECELMLEGEPVLISYDQSRLRYAAIRHTGEQPFCTEKTCLCHSDSILYREYIYTPYQEGLLTESEAKALQWGKTI